MGYGWEGEFVRLVPLDEERHFNNIVRWLQDPDLTRTLGFNDYPITKEAEREWWNQNAKGRPSDIIFAVETLAGVHIGQSGIHQINHHSRTCMTGSFIADEAHRGKGYGTDAAIVRARYCFDVLNMNTVYTGYIEGNDASRRMSEKIGCRQWGVKPNAFWKRGAYRAEVCMYLTREMFEAAAGQK